MALCASRGSAIMAKISGGSRLLVLIVLARWWRSTINFVEVTSFGGLQANRRKSPSDCSS